MKSLTPKQRETLRLLQKATRISCGVLWHIEYTYKGKQRFTQVDGRSCNALVRAGVLIRSGPGYSVDEIGGDYELAEEYRGKQQ